MSETIHTVTVDETDHNARLDKFLAARLPELSRSRLKALIEAGCVASDARTIEDASAKVKRGERYAVTIPETKASHILPQKIALDVVYEDDHILILNKPAGLTVHPAPGHPDMTLVNALLAHCGASLSGIGGVARPGIVHRIDKDTSGLLAVAKNDAAHLALSDQLAKRTMKRAYLALVWGAPKTKTGTITGNIGRSNVNRQKMAVVKKGGKPATTHYKVIKMLPAKPGGFAMERRRTRRADGSGDSSPPLFSLLECTLETGRTHQIRVHLTQAGHPIVGDPAYGQPTKQRLNANVYKSLSDTACEALLAFGRQALHAKALGLIHPATGEKMSFSCDPPPDMQALLAALN